MEVGRDPWKAENVIYERVAAVESRRSGGIQIYVKLSSLIVPSEDCATVELPQGGYRVSS